MQDSYWRGKVENLGWSDRFVLGCAIVGLAILIGSNLSQPATSSHEYNGSKASDYAALCAESLSRDISPTEGDYCGLAAQYRSAAAAESSRYAAWSAATLTLVGVFFLWRTLVYTRKTLGEAERTTKAVIMEQRPWITCEIISVKTFSKRGYWVDLKIQNIGKNSAKGIRLFKMHKESDTLDMMWPAGFVEECLKKNQSLQTRGLTARECMPQGSVAEKVSFTRTLITDDDNLNNTDPNCYELFSDCQGAIVVLYTWGDEADIGCNAFTFACRAPSEQGNLAAAITGRGFPLEHWIVRGTERYD